MALGVPLKYSDRVRRRSGNNALDTGVYVDATRDHLRSKDTKPRILRMHRLSDIVSRVTRRSSPVVLGLATAATLAACGSGGMTASTTSPTPPPPTAATVNATPQIAFSPAQVTVTAGGTVTFAFGSVGHNVYFDNDPAGAPADIPGVNSNANVDRVFGTEGVYAFNCHIHPGMHGTITVVASNAGYP